MFLGRLGPITLVVGARAPRRGHRLLPPARRSGRSLARKQAQRARVVVIGLGRFGSSLAARARPTRASRSSASTPTPSVVARARRATHPRRRRPTPPTRRRCASSPSPSSTGPSSVIGTDLEASILTGVAPARTGRRERLGQGDQQRRTAEILDADRRRTTSSGPSTTWASGSRTSSLAGCSTTSSSTRGTCPLRREPRVHRGANAVVGGRGALSRSRRPRRGRGRRWGPRRSGPPGSRRRPGAPATTPSASRRRRRPRAR